MQDQIGHVPEKTVAVGTFFNRSTIVHVSPTRVLLMDSDAQVQHTVCEPAADIPMIVAASIADPYLVIRRADGGITLFVGDSVARTVSLAPTPESLPTCQAAEVFTDVSGLYRTFEATQKDEHEHGADGPQAAKTSKPTQRTRAQLTGEQLKRLQAAKPAIASDSATTESAFNASRGTQWLATLASSGELQVGRCGIPPLTPDPLAPRPHSCTPVARRVRLGSIVYG